MGIRRSPPQRGARDGALDESRYLLGCAYVKLGRFEESVLEFEQISGALPDAGTEADRLYAYAFALARVERFQESEDTMARIDPLTLPEDRMRHLDRLRVYVRGRLQRGDLEPPRVH